MLQKDPKVPGAGEASTLGGLRRKTLLLRSGRVEEAQRLVKRALWVGLIGKTSLYFLVES